MDVEGSYWGHRENTRLQIPGPSATEIWKKTKRFSKEKCYLTSFQVAVRSRGMCEGSISILKIVRCWLNAFCLSCLNLLFNQLFQSIKLLFHQSYSRTLSCLMHIMVVLMHSLYSLAQLLLQLFYAAFATTTLFYWFIFLTKPALVLLSVWLSHTRTCLTCLVMESCVPDFSCDMCYWWLS